MFNLRRLIRRTTLNFHAKTISHKGKTLQNINIKTINIKGAKKNNK